MQNEIIHLPFDVDLLPAAPLKAGDLTCLYEAGNLRYIKWGDIEIIRMIYGAVRDENWYTAPYQIEGEAVQVNKDSFHISYTAFYALNDIRYKAIFTITGSENKIDVRMSGEALSHFSRNRIGLCVHHPISECAGKNVHIEQPDGRNYEAVFPEGISPHQPFQAIKKMSWNASGALHCALHFEGAVFETEDQRNWTDSSYKTYSTPLAFPFPVQVAAGEIIAQRITLEVTPTGFEAFVLKSKRITRDERYPFPKIGYARPAHSPHITETESRLLQQIPFDHYRVELHFDKDWETDLKNALAEAKQLKTRLELVLFFHHAIENTLAAFVRFIEKQSHLINSVLPLQASAKVTDPSLLEQVHGVLKKLDAGIKVGYGTNGFFADLNRNRPPTDKYDFVSFSLNPQVHLSDTRSLIENLEAQADTIKTIKTFCNNKAVHVSPVTMKIRDKTQSDEKETAGYDARQHTSFGAFWTLVCIANLSAADRITVYHTVGPCSILANALHKETAGHAAAPLYEALVHIKAFNPKWIKRNAATNAVLLENEKGAPLLYTCDLDFQSRTIL